MKNPYKPGDWVRLKSTVKDGYGDEWHHKGDVEKIKYIASDGEGLMFESHMGVHFTQVSPSLPPRQIGRYFGLSLSKR